MKFADINKRYTEIVTEYLSKGYIINTATMSGSQGEFAKIDLTNGKEIIRVLLDSFHDYRNEVDGFDIIVGKSADKVDVHGNDRLGNTIWNKNLEVIETIRFYELGRGIGNDYYGTMEEAKEASELRYARWYNQKVEKTQYTPSARAMEIAKQIVREKMGYQRITASEVKLTKDKRGYTVSYKGKSYRLH